MSEATDQRELPEKTRRRMDVPTELRARITHALRTRHAPADSMAGVAEDKAKTGAGILWRAMRRRPVVSSAAIGAVGLAAAMTIGVGELAAAAIVGYAAFQVLREGVPAKQAAERAIEELGAV